MHSFIHKRKTAVLAACLSVAMPSPAFAKCDILSLCACSVSASGVAFGSYDPFSSTPTTSSGTISVDCLLVLALAGSYDIALSAGSSGNYSQRTLKKGGASLNYNLYTSPARTQIWGDGSGVSAKLTRTFAALLAVSQTTNVYGEIPSGQNVPAGAYTDTITITITY